MHKQAKGIEFP